MYHELMKIHITEEMKQIARSLSNEVMSRQKIQTTENYTGLTQSDRYYVGYLGEQVFKQALQGKRFDYKVGTTGNSEGWDFRVYYKGHPITIDVKTASSTKSEHIAMPQSQSKSIYDRYVGVVLDGDVAYIEGYCSFEDFELQEWKIPTLCCEYRSSRPIARMLDKIDLV